MAKNKKSNTPVAKAASPIQAELSDARITALAHAVTDIIIERLRAEMPIYARLAAADTKHTPEGAERVLRQAVKEGRLASKIINETKEG